MNLTWFFVFLVSLCNLGWTAPSGHPSVDFNVGAYGAKRSRGSALGGSSSNILIVEDEEEPVISEEGGLIEWLRDAQTKERPLGLVSRLDNIVNFLAQSVARKFP